MVLYMMNRNAKGSINRIAFVCLLGSFAHLWKHCEKVQAHYHLPKNICISVNGCHIVDTAALHVLFFESHGENNPELELTRGFCHYLRLNVLN